MSNWFVKRTNLNELAGNMSAVRCARAFEAQTTPVSSTACPIQDDVVLKRFMSAMEIDSGKLFFTRCAVAGLAYARVEGICHRACTFLQCSRYLQQQPVSRHCGL